MSDQTPTDWTPKPGEWVMVQVTSKTYFPEYFRISVDFGREEQIHKSALRPAPPALTPEAQAVLDAAVDYADNKNSIDYLIRAAREYFKNLDPNRLCDPFELAAAALYKMTDVNTFAKTALARIKALMKETDDGANSRRC